MTRIAILDNTVLATFLDTGHIDLLQKTQTTFRFFLIPEGVRNEFLNVPPAYLINRQRFTDAMSPDAGFYRLCNTLDEITLAFLQTSKGIHAGEAEAIAQAERRKVFLFFTDDKQCQTFTQEKFPYLLTMGTPALIALFDINRHFWK